MSQTIRVLEHPDESSRGLRVFGRAMIGLAGVNKLDPQQLLEPGRFLGAVEDEHIVGGADSYTSWLVVPGDAQVPHAAVTHVGVLPTHTRRGIVSKLIAAQLYDFAARGEIVATLRASEATIYGRFGYAVASSAATIAVTRARAKMLPGVADPGPVRLADDDEEATDLAKRVYQDAKWVGAIKRPDQWWNLHDLQREKRPTPDYFVSFQEGGTDTGYAQYRPAGTDHWFSGERREVIVDDFVAHTDSAYLALFRHLLGLDLVDHITFLSRPIDDPLPDLLADRRAAQVSEVRDETWLRIVDVEAALAARSYRAGKPVVLTVSDPLLAANNATFEVGPDKIRRIDATPDLTVSVTGLAATYLGGTTWQRVVLTGLARENTEGAATRADLLFGTTRPPYAGTIF